MLAPATAPPVSKAAALHAASLAGARPCRAGARGAVVNGHLDRLLSPAYDASTLHPEHLADLRRSGLTDEMGRAQKIRTIPPVMIDQLLGFEAPKVRHAYLIPFPDPSGGWMDHVRMKVFPAIETERGTIKYL